MFKAKNYALFFIVLMLPIVSQESAILQNLPDELRDQIEREIGTSLDARSSENIIIENSLDQQNALETTIAPTEEEETVFGFNFFEKTPTTNAPVLDIPLTSDYLISLDDKLELLLAGSTNKLIDLRVDLSGNILIPEVGSMNVKDMPLSEANKKINALVSSSYVGVKAALSVKKPSLRKISVIGAVKKPGTYLVNPFISLSEAIKYASGLKENASIRTIEVISINGDSNTYDMYEFLIYGNRKIDVSLRNGDTVLIHPTSNILSIDGEVHRKGNYEYKSSDTYADLLDYAAGTNNKAIESRIFKVENIDGDVVASQVDLNESVSDSLLESLYVGKETSNSKKSALVFGDEVSSGYYPYSFGDNLSDLIGSLDFSDDIYPFFARLKHTKNNGKEIIYEFFSLNDPSTQEISLLENVEVEFFDRKMIQEVNFYRKIKISFETAVFDMPIIGKFFPMQVFSFFDLPSKRQPSQVFVQGLATDNFFENSFEKEFDAFNVTNIYFKNNDVPNFIDVNIVGAVNTPGTYKVNENTTLNDFYSISGGTTEDYDSLIFIVTRKSIAEKERAALNMSRKIISDALIQSIANPIDSGNAPVNIELNSIIDLLSDADVYGRIAGDFSPDTENARNLTLENGDTVNVIRRQSTVTIVGEVLNPVTVTYNDTFQPQDYYSLAGGFSKYADKSQIYIIKASGDSIPINQSLFARENYLEPGDVIVVPRDIEKLSTVPLVSVATKIISDIAFAAASLNVLQN